MLSSLTPELGVLATPTKQDDSIAYASTDRPSSLMSGAYIELVPICGLPLLS